MGAPTISDVARAAGVSIKTVSRVLNREGSVAQLTRERVEEAVRGLKYRPNLSARSLAGSRSYLISLLYDHSNTADYVMKLQSGAMKECQKAGYRLIIESLDSSSPEFMFEVESILGGVPSDGLILIPPLADDERLLGVLDAMEIPYVRVSPYRQSTRGPHVGIDDAGAAFEMTCMLLDLGHKDVAFIAGHPNHGATHLRFGGYSAALRSRGVPLREKWIRHGDFSARSGIEQGEALLSLSDRPTAIFASNDEMAMGVLFVANRLGLKVPQDLSISGFDDSAAARLVWPQLTTVRQPTAEMCAAAVAMLVSRRADGPAATLLDFELIRRGTTAAAPTKLQA